MKLKNNLIFMIFTIICIVLIYQVPFAFSDTVHFDSDGLVIDKIHYEIIVWEREKALRTTLRNGYNSGFNVWKDPIKLILHPRSGWAQDAPSKGAITLGKPLRG